MKKETMMRNNTTPHGAARSGSRRIARCGSAPCARFTATAPTVASASAFARTLTAALALPIARTFAALPATHALAQANATSAAQVPSLLGGKVQALVPNAAGDTLADVSLGADAQFLTRASVE
jgi:hypothetical protein